MIHKKLLEFQKQAITIVKDAENPHFRSRYSSLNEVLDKVKGPLNELGIVIVQTPTVDGLTTTLIDTDDGSKVESHVPFVGATDMQKLGGAITYARRYSLIALLGLEDEDDDGNLVSQPPRPVAKPAAAKPTTAPTAPDASTEEDDFMQGMPTF
jgi:hypothetical protein